MSDETMILGARIGGEIFGRFIERCSYILGGETYVLEDGAGDEPLVLRRKSDGRRYEVELEAIVTELDAAELARRADLVRLLAARAVA
jgi:hypothetical protein